MIKSGSVPVEPQRTKESLTIPTIAQKSLELISLKMNNLRSSSSRSHMSSMSDNTVNKEEVSLTNISLENNWQNWKLPLVSQNKIYKKTTFSNLTFLSNYTIKTQAYQRPHAYQRRRLSD